VDYGGRKYQRSNRVVAPFKLVLLWSWMTVLRRPKRVPIFRLPCNLTPQNSSRETAKNHFAILSAANN
jgi:hypothetical protein